MELVQQNDVGTDIKLTFVEDDSAVDISAASVKSIMVEKPSGTVDTHTAAFFTDGTDGIIIYTIVDGDIDEVGSYSMQGLFTSPSGTWYTDIHKFRVTPNLA